MAHFAVNVQEPGANAVIVTEYDDCDDAYRGFALAIGNGKPGTAVKLFIERKCYSSCIVQDYRQG